MTVFAFGAFSVALWLSVLVWYFFLLGVTVSFGYAQLGASDVDRSIGPAPLDAAAD
jgi:hypothetical protein